MSALRIVLVLCFLVQIPAYASNGDVPDSVNVGDVAFIDAHNIAMSSKYGWLYAQQGKTVTDLLANYGVRSMKVPVHWYHKKSFIRGIQKAFGKKKGKNLPYPALCHEEDGGNNCKGSVLQRGGKAPEPLKKLLYHFCKINYYIS